MNCTYCTFTSLLHFVDVVSWSCQVNFNSNRAVKFLKKLFWNWKIWWRRSLLLCSFFFHGFLENYRKMYYCSNVCERLWHSFFPKTRNSSSKRKTLCYQKPEIQFPFPFIDNHGRNTSFRAIKFPRVRNIFSFLDSRWKMIGAAWLGWERVRNSKRGKRDQENSLYS